MVNHIPLELQFLIEDSATSDKRLRFRFLYGDKTNLKPNTKATGRHYCVPIGFGWGPFAGEQKRLLFYKTYTGSSYRIGRLIFDDIAVIETIPSHTEGNKAKELWRAPWYSGV